MYPHIKDRFNQQGFYRTGLTVLLLLVASCGGGSDGPAPPLAFSYTQPPAFVLNQVIAPLTPTVMGQVTSYSVSPALPAGLMLSSNTGVVSGTPTAISAAITYTVTAMNSGGSATANILIAVNDLPPILGYSSPYYAYTAGVPAQTITPGVGGGTVVTWSVSPPLPTGLALSAIDGSISGLPTAPAATANYIVTASNSGGPSSTTLAISISASPLLDLGLVSTITFIKDVNSSVLSQDKTGRWLLIDFASGSTLASGQSALLADGTQSPIDLENAFMIDESGTGLEIRSAASGQVLATVHVPATFSWYRLAVDGSYVVIGGSTGITVWSTSGQILVSSAGDYSQAIPFAASGQVLIALGPAGQNVIETISVATGNSSVSPNFQGSFNSWFVDGQRFLSNLGSTVWTYSNAAVQQDLTAVSSVTGLSGQGDWFWTWTENNSLNVYQVGNSASPTLSAPFNILSTAFPSGNTIGVLPFGAGQLTIIDLSGATPVSTNYTLPYADLSVYAATSATQWLVGNVHGVVFDGASLGGQPRSLTLGAVWSIAGGSGFVSIATASGRIFSFDVSNNSLVGSINFSSSQLSASTDGTILAAAGNSNDFQYEPDRTLNIYSLPSGATITSFPYSYPQTDLIYMSMSGAGNVASNIFAQPTTACLTQVIPIASGIPILCDNTLAGLVAATVDIALSPDGTLAATSGVASTTVTTNIYKNGTLATTVPGQVVGWLDNTQLVVGNYINGSAGYPVPGSTAIYDSLGNKVSNPALAGLAPFQTVAPDLVYVPLSNDIESLVTGASTWASANASLGVGAVAGPQIVFASGNLVLAQAH